MLCFQVSLQDPVIMSRLTTASFLAVVTVLSDLAASLTFPRHCFCPDNVKPFCGNDEVTYDNFCFLRCAGQVGHLSTEEDNYLFIELDNTLPPMGALSQTVQCPGPCPCPPPKPGSDGCTQFCIPLLGPAPPERPPKERSAIFTSCSQLSSS